MKSMKSKKMRVLCFALALICAVALAPVFSPAMNASAAAKLGLDKTKVTITAGHTAKVTATGLSTDNLKKVTWKSSDTTAVNIHRTKGPSVIVL